MKLNTPWRAFLVSLDMAEFARARMEHHVHFKGEHARKLHRVAIAQRIRRERQAMKLAERITAKLDAIENADQWTYIDKDDPTTLPEDSAKNYSWTWYSAAWIDNNGYKCVEKSSFQNGEWYDWRGPGATLRGPHWHVYAWQPWPKAPLVGE